MLIIKYPKLLRKLNDRLAWGSGIIFVIIMVLFLIEAITRYIFGHALSWVTDVCTYLQCLALFMGCARGYETKDHVGVDIFRNWVDRRTNRSHNRIYARIMSVVGWFQTIVYLGALLYACIITTAQCFKLDIETWGVFTIPKGWLFVIADVGLILSIIVLIFMNIVLTTSKDDEFIG